MNKELKKALKEIYGAPTAQRKEEFLKSIHQPSITNSSFVFLQIRYIRKLNWVFSVLIFLLALFGTKYLEEDILWCVSAFMPMLALLFVTEDGRSETYKMAELELSTRFSLKSVLFARLGILGLSNCILICTFVPFLQINNNFNIFQTAIYLFVPYLLTAFLGLFASRKTNDIQTNLISISIACSISIIYLILYKSIATLYTNQLLLLWIILFFVCVGGIVVEYLKRINNTEELVWN